VIAVLASSLGDPGFPRALLACVAVGAFAPTIGAFLVQKRLSLIGDGVGSSTCGPCGPPWRSR
jgi:ABC-type Mn2+/Zn2+ transport system permease subunit